MIEPSDYLMYRPRRILLMRLLPSSDHVKRFAMVRSIPTEPYEFSRWLRASKIQEREASWLWDALRGVCG
jgi:hypothetical protein